jgi:hypothetical protein
MSNLNILVFGYKRPLILEACLKSLNDNLLSKEAKVTICIDGLNEKDKLDSKSIRDQAELIRIASDGKWCKEQEVIVNKTNFGIRKQYFSKIDLLLDTAENLVVLEEDAIVGKWFLDYMQNAFARYGKDKMVGIIAGYTYHIELLGHNHAAFFAKGSGNKAFGISKTFWNGVDKECTGWEQLKSDNALRKRYNIPGVDLAAILIDEIENNRNNAWDSIVYYNAFKNGLLSLIPDKTLSIDNGWGDDATNCVGENMFDANVFDIDYKIEHFPASVKEDKKKKALIHFYFAYFLRYKFLVKRIKKIF